MASVGSVKMINGVSIPLIGLGTWNGNWTDSMEPQFEKAVRHALDVGYRHFDTATWYQNEHVVGRVIAEYITSGKVRREDLFISGKLPIFGHADPAKHLEESLQKLKLEYFDLYMIHFPAPMKFEKREDFFGGRAEVQVIPHIDTWRVLETKYNEGKVKSLGIANFNQQQICDLFEKATVKPMNLQVECHLLHQQREPKSFCDKIGLSMTAYAPLGSTGRPAVVKKGVPADENPLKHPIAAKLAGKYQKSPAQILIRQLIQRGIAVIPKSTNAQRLEENINVLDFELTTAEVDELDAISDDKQLFFYEFVKDHPYYPWTEELSKKT